MVPVSFEFAFCGEDFRLTPSLALYWPRENAVIVADLHLEKGSFFAQWGQMLPPYDSRATLDKLEQTLAETGAKRVFTLGDNFHDAAGVARMDESTADQLSTLTRSVDWVWITGNHDHNHYGPKTQGLKNGSKKRSHSALESAQQEENRRTMAAVGGTEEEELLINGLVLRHQTKAGETRPELSGHYHPRYQTRIRGRNLRKACAVMSHSCGASGKLIMPAFGAFTGGMDANDPAIRNALQPSDAIDALVPAREKLVRVPLWRKAQ